MKEPLYGYPDTVDITNCDREPIHIIGSSQAHGVIMACNRETFTITHCSQNSGDLLGYPAEDLLGRSLDVLFGINILESRLPASGEKFVLTELPFFNKDFLIIIHSNECQFILEFEPLGEVVVPIKYQEQLSGILNELNPDRTIKEVTEKAANLVKVMFEYDRVMIYQFDEEWNGKVVAEEKEDNLESWLGLNYPATDIPKSSRDLFLKQEIRIISEVSYLPSPIISDGSPETAKPLDLSLSELRGVSPIHIQYLKNMQVGASLTAAIVLNGKLWGLIACHHSRPKFINYYQRQSVKFLTQIFTNTLSVITTRNFIAASEKSRIRQNNFLSGLELENNLIRGLLRQDILFSSLVSCTSGAIYRNGEVHLQGLTPPKGDVIQLIRAVLIKKVSGVFHTQNLENIYPPASAFRHIASGLLAINFGEDQEDFMIWFKPETSREVSWGGKPEKKSVDKEGVKFLHPRKSFEKWTERLTGIATPWKEHELDIVSSLREGINNVIIRQQKEKIKQLNTVLTQVNNDLSAFSYSVSHDLRAPLRGISGYAKILDKNYYENLDEGGRKALEVILQSAEDMNQLIGDLLSYAKIGQLEVNLSPVNVYSLVQNILISQNIETEYAGTRIITDKELPDCLGDKKLIFQLFSNLINNALKYSAEKPAPEVRIGFLQKKQTIIYFVKDNGIGFDSILEEKIYKVFSRLVGDEYPGTGVGLATADKVVKKHQGDLWVETSPGNGACFYFTLGSRHLQ